MDKTFKIFLNRAFVELVNILLIILSLALHQTDPLKLSCPVLLSVCLSVCCQFNWQMIIVDQSLMNCSILHCTMGTRHINKRGFGSKLLKARDFNYILVNTSKHLINCTHTPDVRYTFKETNERRIFLQFRTHYTAAYLYCTVQQ